MFITPVGVSTPLVLLDLVLSLACGTMSTGFTVSWKDPPRTHEHVLTLLCETGVGPTAGALIAWGFYKIIKMLEYEMANPGEYFYQAVHPSRDSSSRD